MSSAGGYGALFVGRARELRELGAALDAAFAGRGALLLVRGEPGAGKTSLAQQFAVAATARGALVAWGRSAEGDAPPAFWAWAQCLRAIAGRRTLEEMLRDFAASERDLLASLVDLRAPQDARPHARFLLFEAVARLLRQESLGRPVVLILDDLQDADAASLLLLRFLVDRLGDSQTLVLGLAREREAGVPATTSRLLHELAARASILPVQGLSEGDIQALYRARSGHAAGDVLVRNLAWASGGNALFVDELVRAISVEGESYPVRVHGRLPVTDRARHAIRRRLESLPEESSDALRTASVLGYRFGIDLLARLLGRSFEAVAAAVEQLEAVHLIEPIPDDPGARRFTHALFRDVLYADLGALRCAALHRRAAEVLEAEAMEGGDRRAATDLAHHWWEARPAGADPERARVWIIRAADAAIERLAYEEAAELYRRAVESSPPEDPRTADLLLSLGRALWSAGEVGEARAAFERAAKVARALRDARRLAEAALGCGAGVGAPYVSYGPDPLLVDLLEEALAILPAAEASLRASCLARLALALHHGSSPADRRAALADEAIAIAARLRDPALRLTALFSRQWALFGLDTLAERVAVADEILRLAVETGSPEVYWAHYFRLTVALDSGHFPAIAREIDRCETAARAVPLPLVQWRTTTLRAMRAILEGSLAEAEAEAARARDIGERSRGDLVPAAFVGQMHVIRWLQGRLREIEPEVRAFADRFPWSSRWRAGLAWLYAESGRAADAQAELQRVATPGLVEGPRDGSWGVRLYALSMTVAYLGDAAAASELYEALRPFADRTFTNGTVLVSWGSASVPLGMLAATLGRLDDADTHLRTAVAANTRLGNRPFMALALREHAAVLLARGTAGDRTEAARLLDDAALLMREHGFDGLLARTAALRAEADATSPRTPPRPAVENMIRREGHYWTVGFDGDSVRFRDTKGLRYLAYLMLRPGVEIHALELAAEHDAPDDRGGGVLAGADRGTRPIALDPLDARARRELRGRASDLGDELRDAEAWNDRGRAERARQEIAFLERELGAAYGIGGRPRRAADPAERARKAVTERIRWTIARIEQESPALARYLTRSVRTGTFCVFRPERDETWRS